MKNIFVLLLLLSDLSFGQVNLQLGLRAYYPFSGNADDISGSNNHPVFNNAKLTADRFGNPKSAYYFNGKNTYMKIPNSSSLNMANKMSISLWVKPTGFYTGKCYNNMLVTKSATTTFASNFYLRFADVYTGCDAPTTTLERFTGNNAIAATPLVQLNQWYSVVWTSDGATERIYVNCELKASVRAGAVPFSNSYDMFFGCQNSAQYPYWLNGNLDEVRIYNRALNQEEIFALCEKSPPITKSKPANEKIKENKAKDIGKQKTEVAKPKAVNESNPLITIKNPADINPGSIKPLDFGTEKEIVLEQRKNDLVKEITVDNDSISITLYDNGIIDGDSVTLIYNNAILTTHQLLTEKPVTFYIKIAAGNSQNELVMYAENLGSIPPNTALMVIYDGNKRYELSVSSSKTRNGVVSFKLRK